MDELTLAGVTEAASGYIDAKWLPIVAVSTLLPTAMLLSLMLLDGGLGLVALVTGKKWTAVERSLPPLPDEADDEGAWTALADECLNADGELSAWPALLEIQKGLEAMPPEERRRLKLETGTNWPPRTPTTQPFSIDREGFMFFQGPTPLTAVQEGLPSFLSGDNFRGLEVPRVLLVLGGVFGATFLALALSLLLL